MLGLRSIGAVVTGRGHVAQGLPCQDRVVTARSGRQWAVTVLADGAGSASCSGLGAGLVVTKLARMLPARFAEYFLRPDVARFEIIEHLQRRLGELATLHGRPLRDFASTLLFVMVHRTGRRLRYLAGHLGDGVIALECSGRMQPFSYPQNGEFANSTHFVSDSNAAEKLRIYRGVIAGPAGFVLMSDGAAESLYQRQRKEMAPACQRLLELQRRVSGKRFGKVLQESLDILHRRTFDDCTLALLACLGGRKTKAGHYPLC